MRWFHGALASLLLGVLGVACNTVDPGECWPNTSGGLGGGPETIPIGAGVGASSSGDFITPPPKWPLGNGDAPENPCVLQESPPKSPPQVACEVPALAGDSATAWVCTDACLGKCPVPGGGLYVKFSPSDFPFVTTVKDDGTGKAGGWRVAKVNLEFTHAVIPMSVVTWWCPFNIEMPLRTEGMGTITTSQAADFSAEITEGVARDPDTDYSLPQGIFCFQFVKDVRAAFKLKYPLLGATAVIK